MNKIKIIKIISPAGGGGVKRRGWSLPIITPSLLPLAYRLLAFFLLPRATFRWLAFILLPLAFCLAPLASYPQTTYTLTGNMCGTGLDGNTCVGAGSTGTGSGLVSETYPAGTKVTLAPSAKDGFIFVGWLGEGLWGNKITSIVMNSDKFVAAIFEPIIKRKLYVSIWGTGSGTITSAPAGINCGVACIFDFNENTKVTLTATPAAGSVFAGWRPTTLGCTGTTPTCAVSLTKAKIVTGLFTKQ